MHIHWDFLGGSGIKNLPANEGDEGLIPGSGRFLGEGNGHAPKYSCLGNPKYRGDWQGSQRSQHDLATKQQQTITMHVYYLMWSS